MGVRTSEECDISEVQDLPNKWECPRCHAENGMSPTAEEVFEVFDAYCAECGRCFYVHTWVRRKNEK